MSLRRAFQEWRLRRKYRKIGEALGQAFENWVSGKRDS